MHGNRLHCSWIKISFFADLQSALIVLRGFVISLFILVSSFLDFQPQQFLKTSNVIMNGRGDYQVHCFMV